MKTLIGVDNEGQYLDAILLLGRLRFRANQILLAHVQAPILDPVYAAPSTYIPDPSLDKKLREAGQKLLQTAEREARAVDLGHTFDKHYLVGPKVGCLMDIATDHEVDLLAIGSGNKGTLESVLTGSVGRTLAADAVQSFLIARDQRRAAGGVRAVYASDLSIYSDRCLDRFIGMVPEGLEAISVITATERRGKEDLVQQFGYGPDDHVSDEELRRIGTEVGEGMAERLRSLGYRATFSLEEGYPHEALPTAMARTRSELLVLGAKGHKFIDRLLHGSVSYHQVSSQPYSVLVLRERQESLPT